MNDPDWVANNRRARYNIMPGVETWKAAYTLSQEEARDIAVEKLSADERSVLKERRYERTDKLTLRVYRRSHTKILI